MSWGQLERSGLVKIGLEDCSGSSWQLRVVVFYPSRGCGSEPLVRWSSNLRSRFFPSPSPWLWGVRDIAIQLNLANSACLLNSLFTLPQVSEETYFWVITRQSRAETSYTDESLWSSVWTANPSAPTGLWPDVGRCCGNCDAEVSTICNQFLKQLNWHLLSTCLSLGWGYLFATSLLMKVPDWPQLWLESLTSLQQRG